MSYSDFWDDKEAWFVCPNCKTADFVIQYSQILNGYNIFGEHVGTKDWGCDYSFVICEECGWDTI